MLTIRLLRTGKRNQPTFKIVVTDKNNPPKGGRFLEEVGFYNPVKKERGLKKERIQYWLSQGVKPSDTVHNMLVSENVIEGAKKAVHKEPKTEEKPAGAPKEEKLSTEEKPPEKPKKETIDAEPHPVPEKEKKEETLAAETASEPKTEEKPAEAASKEKPLKPAETA